MKPGCIPLNFECQAGRRKRTSNTTERPYILKKQRKTLIEECVNDLEERTITTQHLELGETSSGSSVSHENKDNSRQEEYQQEEHQQEKNHQKKTADKSIQVYMTHKYRSKGIQTKIKSVNQMTSPLKPKCTFY